MTLSLDLAYNTDMEKLTIPEYGRNVQKMIEHAKKIENKELVVVVAVVWALG